MTSHPGRPVRHLRTGQTGVAFPVFRDSHVHLGLVDASSLPRGGIGAVVDLGWSEAVAALADSAPVDVAYAGCFLTAAGGYPSDRSWAPPGSTVAVDPESAATAVARQVALGAEVIKVTLNADAGPVPDHTTLTALIQAAGVPVVAHVEGDGMFEAALEARVDVLAHTPWTVRLRPAQIDAAAAAQTWISTLDMHGRGDRTPATETALANLGDFRAARGRVLYGTDLGNGPLPVGLNLRELRLLREAGLDDDALLDALTAAWPRPVAPGRHTFVPGERDCDLIEWLARGIVVETEDLEEI